MKGTLYRFLFSFGLSAGMFLGCNEDTVDPAFFGAIQGSVTYKSTGLAAVGVQVATIPTTSTVITDALGGFTLPDVPAGEYTVVAEHDAYQRETRKIVVTRNNTTQADFQLSADAAAPSAPAAPFPVNGAGDIDRIVTLKWSVIEKNDDELTFDVVVFESNQQVPLLEVEDIADTVITVEALKFNTMYFWQVNVSNSAGMTTHGELWQFKTLPFPDNRYLFSSQRDGNYEIYSSGESGDNLVRLTYNDNDQVFPHYSNNRALIAYAAHTDLEYHLYTMNRDGDSPSRVTTLPVAGFHNDGRGFCWSPDNGKLLYSHYDKLYAIDRNGSNLTLIATAPAGRTFRGCDWTAVGDKIVVETVGTLSYQSEIRLIDLVNETDDILVTDEPGTIQSPTFSIDGKYVLFTRDVSGFESSTGRQLDSRLFILEIGTGIRTDLSVDKPDGTNDLNPRYSPDGAKIIFENRANDGSGLPAIYTYDIAAEKRTKLIDDAAMADWQ